MNVIGLKKCPNCGFKELYGCHNYYTTGAPFNCPKCDTAMNYVPYAMDNSYVSDEEYEKVENLLEKNLETLDYVVTEKERGALTIKWVGIRD